MLRMCKKENMEIGRKEVIEFIKFCIVGGVNTLINLAVLFLLTEFLHIYYLISAVFAFLVAVTNSFILNKIWTFNYKTKNKLAFKYSQFFIVSIFALGVNLSVLYTLTEFFHVYYLFSQLIGVVFNLIINFLGNKLWTFKR